MDKKSQTVNPNGDILGQLEMVELEEKTELSPVGVLVLAALVAAGALAVIAERLLA
jgi:hypothetical protein